MLKFSISSSVYFASLVAVFFRETVQTKLKLFLEKFPKTGGGGRVREHYKYPFILPRIYKINEIAPFVKRIVISANLYLYRKIKHFKKGRVSSSSLSCSYIIATNGNRG